MKNKLSDFEKLESLDAAPRIGLYFLFFKNKLQYIGKSIDVYARLAQHRNNGIDFDSVKFTKIEEESMRDFMEIKMIWDLKPPLNLYIIDPKKYLDEKKSPSQESIDMGFKKNPETNIPFKTVHKLPKKPKNNYKKQELFKILKQSKNTSKVLETLTETESDIIIKRYGLFGNKEWTLRSIGRLYGLTHERIRQIQKVAENKLKHTTRYSKL